MAKELAKVYVEHMATGLEHNIVIVSITDTQDIGGHAASRTGVDEILHSLRNSRK